MSEFHAVVPPLLSARARCCCWRRRLCFTKEIRIVASLAALWELNESEGEGAGQTREDLVFGSDSLGRIRELTRPPAQLAARTLPSTLYTLNSLTGSTFISQPISLPQPLESPSSVTRPSL